MQILLGVTLIRTHKQREVREARKVVQLYIDQGTVQVANNESVCAYHIQSSIAGTNQRRASMLLHSKQYQTTVESMSLLYARRCACKIALFG